MITNSWPVRIGAVLLATVSVTAFAGPAFAAGTDGKASVSGTKVSFTAGAKVVNRVVVSRSGHTVTIDDRVKIKAGKGCKAVKGDKTKVRCTVKKTPDRVEVKLYDRDDSVVNKSGLRLLAEGGTGKDKLVGGSGRDVLSGMSGADQLYGLGGSDRLDGGTGSDLISGGDAGDLLIGGTGHDVLYGGNGDDELEGLDGNDKLYAGAGTDILFGDKGTDHLEGGAGDDQLSGDGSGPAYADVLLGGSGTDIVSYFDSDSGVTVDLDGAARDDGRPGEHDTVGADVERLAGSRFADQLTGNDGPNNLQGLTGDDVLRGGGGDDAVDGGDGRDLLYGDAGDDFLNGFEFDTPAADTLDGGPNGLPGDECHPYGLDTAVNCER